MFPTKPCHPHSPTRPYKSFDFLGFHNDFIAPLGPLPNTEERQADELQNLPFSSPESMSFIDGECGGLNEEECLIRRSLAAHTDYIYTQENDAP
ncbi:hypothetical protein V6N13_042338 [Hibiscus sabdariffa]